MAGTLDFVGLRRTSAGGRLSAGAAGAQPAFLIWQVHSLFHREDHFPEGTRVPYRVQLESGDLIYVPQDVEFCIRKA